jgi:hypothetical protein
MCIHVLPGRVFMGKNKKKDLSHKTLCLFFSRSHFFYQFLIKKNNSMFLLGSFFFLFHFQKKLVLKVQFSPKNADFVLFHVIVAIWLVLQSIFQSKKGLNKSTFSPNFSGKRLCCFVFVSQVAETFSFFCPNFYRKQKKSFIEKKNLLLRVFFVHLCFV